MSSAANWERTKHRDTGIWPQKICLICCKIIFMVQKGVCTNFFLHRVHRDFPWSSWLGVITSLRAWLRRPRLTPGTRASLSPCSLSDSEPASDSESEGRRCGRVRVRRDRHGDSELLPGRASGWPRQGGPLYRRRIFKLNCQCRRP